MDTTAKIAEALAAFQAEMPVVHKGKTATVPTKSGGSYSYTYADLADVTEAAMPVLARHGLAFSTCPRRTDDGRYELVGRLLHTSGESLEGSLPIAGNSPQEIGSALTYMRRYLFGSITGLVTDDDDDGAIASAAKRQPKKKQAAPRQQPRDDGPRPLDTSSQLARRMFAAFGDVGISDKDERLAFVADTVGREVATSKDMTEDDARRVIDALRQMQDRQTPPPDDTEPEGWGNNA